MLHILKQIAKTGIKTEPAPLARRGHAPSSRRLQQEILAHARAAR